MKRTIIWLSMLLASFSNLFGQTASQDYWKKIDHPNAGKEGALFIVSGLRINDRGVILAFGYTNESSSTFSSAFGTTQYLKFKVFRSKNNAKTWEDVSNKALGMFDYQLRLSHYEAFTDANFSVLGNQFFINYQNGYFVSEDDGLSWKQVPNEPAIKGAYLFFIDANTRAGAPPPLNLRRWNYAIYKKVGEHWELSVSPDDPKYQNFPPFPIYRGNRVSIFNMANGEKFAGMEYPFYKNEREGQSGKYTGRIVQASKEEADRAISYSSPDVFTPQPFYEAAGAGQYIYALGRNQVLRSADQGKTFDQISIPGIAEINRILPICDNARIFVLGTKKLDNVNTEYVFLGSDNHGDTWQEFKAYPELNAKNTDRRSRNDIIRDVILLNNGRYLVGGTEGLHLSTEKFACQPAAASTPTGTAPQKCFDASSPVHTVTEDGMQIVGSDKFIEIIRSALFQIKKSTPAFYEKYIHSAYYNKIKGYQLDCTKGYNYADNDLFIRVFIGNEKTYIKFQECPQILASILLHEAVHVYQDYYYGKGAEAFKQYYASDVQIAQYCERFAFFIQHQYFIEAYKTCSLKDLLASYWCKIIDLYYSAYPDIDGNHLINEKDNIALGKTGFDPDSKSTCEKYQHPADAIDVEKTKSDFYDIPILIKSTQLAVYAISDNPDTSAAGAKTAGSPKTLKTGHVKTLQGSNLRLRAQASEKSSILTQIPNGSGVTILGEDNHVVTVNGESGKWVKVDYAGTVGWAWGKYIVPD